MNVGLMQHAIGQHRDAADSIRSLALQPFKITVRARLRRVGAPHRRPLSSDLARQTHWHLSGWTEHSVTRVDSAECC